MYIADTTREAREKFGPVYEQIVKIFVSRPGNATPYRDIDHAIELDFGIASNSFFCLSVSFSFLPFDMIPSKTQWAAGAMRLAHLHDFRKAAQHFGTNRLR